MRSTVIDASNETLTGCSTLFCGEPFCFPGTERAA
jgi:hypothetical protein